MLPIAFPQQNQVFTKPESMTDEQCNSLSTFKGKDADGMPVVISAWQPSVEDIEAINRGEPIWLQVCSQGMPPVSIFTENPFITENQNSN